MPRRTINLGDASTSASEEFLSPEEAENQTSYGLEYTAHRIVNPFQSGGNAAPRKMQSTARKTTSHTPAQHVRPATRSSTAEVEQNRTMGARRRKPHQPYKNRALWKNVHKIMQSTDFLVPRLPFGRLVKEIIMDMSRNTGVNRITRLALEALQESTEMYIVQQLQDAYTLTLHRGRVTLQVKDMEVLRFLRGHTLT